jgi:hypothetical protein
MMNGGCYCGRVRYRMHGDPITVNACHCRDCQRLTGSAFAINAMIERDRVDLLAGLPVADAEGAIRCPHCRTLLWASHPMFGEGIVFLRAGTLDENERIVPEHHFFVRSRHPWVTVPKGVPAHETLPGDTDPPVLDAAGMARVAATRAG